MCLLVHRSLVQAAKSSSTQIDYATRRLALWNSTAAGQQTSGSWSKAVLAVGGRQLFMDQQLTDRTQKATHGTYHIPAGLTASSSFFVPILKIYPDRVDIFSIQPNPS